jgi:energy-coupling factor transporter ATP-binding protein EcfA2
MNKIEIQNVSYTYSKGTPFQMIALNDVSVAFEKGKITDMVIYLEKLKDHKDTTVN